MGGTGGRDDFGQCFAFDVQQGGRGDGFDFRYHQCRPFLLDQRAQRRPVGHGDDVAAVGNLHGRRMWIAIDGDDFTAEALQGDGDLLAEFAAAKQHHAGGGGGERGSDWHGDVRTKR